MAHGNTPRPPLARERVAARRPNRPQPQRGGCSFLFVSVTALLLLLGFGAVVFTAGQTLRSMQRDDPRYQGPAGGGPALATTPAAGEPTARALPHTTLEPFTVLLVGVDTRDDPDQIARSDTLIVVHVNPQEQWASMLSIPRDSMTQVPNLGQQKINTAYTYGTLYPEDLYGPGTDPATAGSALAAETVEQFLGLQIDYIAQVDFNGFVRMVDTFGGLQIDIPEPLLDAEYPTENFGFERIYVPAGLQVLDGRTALRYARSRHAGTDFDRSCRQQRVLRALLREVRSRNLLNQATLLPELVQDVQQSVITTMPISDLGVLRGLLELAQSLSSERVLQLSINPSNVQIVAERGSDIYWNERDIQLLVARLLRGPEIEVPPQVAASATAAPERALVQVQNGAGVQGLATRVTQKLGSQGFELIQAGDTPGYYANTLVIDYTGKPETRQRLVDMLGIAPASVQVTPGANAPPAPANADIVLVLGQDYREEWATVTAGASTPLPTVPAAAPVPSVEAPEVPNLPPSCNPDF